VLKSRSVLQYNITSRQMCRELQRAEYAIPIQSHPHIQRRNLRISLPTQPIIIYHAIYGSL
jgi:hypothetical protein